MCFFLSCSPSSEHLEGDENIVTEKDLEHLMSLVEGKVGDATWQNLMERSTPNMTYQAWRHEPEVVFVHVFNVNSSPFTFPNAVKMMYLLPCLSLGCPCK